MARLSNFLFVCFLTPHSSLSVKASKAAAETWGAFPPVWQILSPQFSCNLIDGCSFSGLYLKVLTNNVEDVEALLFWEALLCVINLQLDTSLTSVKKNWYAIFQSLLCHLTSLGFKRWFSLSPIFDVISKWIYTIWLIFSFYSKVFLRSGHASAKSHGLYMVTRQNWCWLGISLDFPLLIISSWPHEKISDSQKEHPVVD